MDFREKYKYQIYSYNGSGYISPLSYIDNEGLRNLVSNSIYSHVVTVVETNNLPLISYNIYNTTDYWSLLGVINGNLNPFNILCTSKIKYPSLTDINNYLKLLSPTNNKNLSNINGLVSI